jgi:hypothetical protein
MLRAAKHLFNSTLARFGFQIEPLTDSRQVESGVHNWPNLRLDCVFSSLKNLGFAPTHILDVGANRGNWTRAALKYFPDAIYTLVEPQDELRIHIQGLEKRGVRINWIHAGQWTVRG